MIPDWQRVSYEKDYNNVSDDHYAILSYEL